MLDIFIGVFYNIFRKKMSREAKIERDKRNYLSK